MSIIMLVFFQCLAAKPISMDIMSMHVGAVTTYTNPRSQVRMLSVQMGSQRAYVTHEMWINKKVPQTLFQRSGTKVGLVNRPLEYNTQQKPCQKSSYDPFVPLCIS